MAMASDDSVTVSIAALASGTLRRMRRVSRVVTSTWLGSTLRVLRHEQHVVEGQGAVDRPRSTSSAAPRGSGEDLSR